MNYTQFAENPKELVFVIFGVIIYFIFRLIHFLVTRKLVNRPKQFLGSLFYFIEVMIWFAYFSEGINLFVHKNIIFSGICAFVLLVAIGWISWFILRDFIAGLFLKMNETFKLDEIIEFDGFSGSVQSIGNRDIEIRIDGSNTVKIPYSQFYIKRLIRAGTSDNCAKSNFIFKLDTSLNAIDAVDAIKVFIYQLPWTNSAHEQEVIIDKMDKQETLISINASLFDQKYKDRFEQKIRERFEQ